MVRVTVAKQVPPINSQQLRDTFKKYDSNGNGLLSKAELENAFKSLGSHFPGWRAGRALHHADANGDNSISLEELDDVVNYAMKHGYVLGK
uniref:EF-hand domain-containing protein n=1 Tax=Fagus sylvatica TaxID=28930 RepID=A0A2N9FZ25_FAGSY